MTFKNLRKINGFDNQIDIAKLLNISRTTISMWESGKSYPTIPTIIKIAELLNVPAEEIFKCFIKGVKK